MKQIPGGVCAAKGFSAAGLRAGIKPTSPADKNDLGLIVSSVPCAAAGVFTTNRVKAAPVWLDKEQLANGTAQVVIANSSIANACAPEGEETCRREMALVSEALDVDASDVLVSSTGVIGVRLNVEAIEAALPELVSKLEASEAGSDAVARAIMTTDTVKKEISYEFQLSVLQEATSPSSAKTAISSSFRTSPFSRARAFSCRSTKSFPQTKSQTSSSIPTLK